jgi:hypothetical protein
VIELTDLTLLELACIEAVIAHHWPGQPVVCIKVAKCQLTGVGGFTSLVDLCDRSIPDGAYGTRDQYIEMVGLQFGLQFELIVQGSRFHELEIVTADASGWDGVERSFVLK